MSTMTRNDQTTVRLSWLGRLLATSVVLATAFQAASADEPATRPAADADRRLYVVGYAHLDTQWRWTYPMVIDDYIPATLDDNFKLFDKFPGYVFNFSGSRRYEMMKEYYPQSYEKLKEYVAAGKWFPAGSSVDEGDANVPSAESGIRHVLYGNRFFRREFGKASDEFMLPDCFGFPAGLPSILAHCGLKGFSTQKLTWGSANGIPFKVGVWEGPDGKSVIAALDPGAYTGRVREDLSQSRGWLTRINNTGDQSGAYVDYHYFGTGDKGGAPDERSVDFVMKSVAGDGPVRVISSQADAMFDAITPEQRVKLPHYKGELLLTEHSAGSITSQAYMKRWNRKNELLADAAETASVAAAWLGGRPYPLARLNAAWDLVLGSQMHDILPGTSVPKAYVYSWNDEVVALNQFAAVETDAVGGVSAALDTRVQGVPVVVYNPLSFARADVVEARVTFDADPPQDVSVTGPDGKAVAAQVTSREDKALNLLFLAKVPSAGYAVYEVKAADAAPAAGSDLKVSEGGLENARFRVALDDDGDIASVFDKKAGREALSAPARLALLNESPKQYPAWNMDWDDRQQPPRGYVGGPARVTVVEDGPARVALRVEREHEGSRYVQTIRLAAGDAGGRVEVATTVDWQTKGASLKATFPMAFGNPNAAYDGHVGVIERGNNDAKKYEVPQHQWFDLTDPTGGYGVAVLNDGKYGSDKPDNETLRLTLLYTPDASAGYSDQGTQDIGRHDMLYAIAPHAGDWRAADVPQTAARLNQPLRAYSTAKHDGPLGKSFSLVSLSNDQVEVMALKKAEDSDEIIVRLHETEGTGADDVTVKFAGGIAAAREVDGQEREIGGVGVTDGKLTVSMTPFSMRSFAVTLSTASADKEAAPQSQPVALEYDLDAISTNADRNDGDFAGGATYPAEQLPRTVTVGGVNFELGSGADGEKNALIATGQTLKLPSGDFDGVYVLAASAGGDRPATFRVGDQPHERTVQAWTGYVGQWDNRLWAGDTPEQKEEVADADMVGLAPGYIKRNDIAWFASHHHHDGKDASYQYAYLFLYRFDRPVGATDLTLPDDPAVRVFAVSVAKVAGSATPMSSLYDDFAGRTDLAAGFATAAGGYKDTIGVELRHPLYYGQDTLHYTTDGSEPTGDSPVYRGPITVDRPTTIKSRVVIDGRKPGPVAEARYEVNDRTPPRVVEARANALTPTLRVRFSEAVDAASAASTQNYLIEPETPINAVELSGDGLTATLTTSKVLSADRDYRLKVEGVKDRAPGGNAASADVATPVTTARPVFELADAGEPLEVRVPALPTKGDEPFTLNLFVRVKQRPMPRTLVAGFGSNVDRPLHGRYFASFAEGIRFWASNADVLTNEPLDTGRWQMLTAVYDGKSVRVYKNAREIGTRAVKLADDEPVVRVRPLEPWDKMRVIDADLRDVSVWSDALSPQDVTALYARLKGAE